jgi:hypothetical protein
LNFLNPLLLFGLAAAAIPLLIHLFTRLKSKTIKFSTLQFLKELQLQQIRRLKLRQLLLLILRMLIIVLLVLSFARPALKSTSSGVSDFAAKTSAVFILDNSYSLGAVQDGTSFYAIARNDLKNLCEVMQPGDDVHLVSTIDTSLAVSRKTYYDLARLQKDVDDIPIGYKPTDLNAALRYAVRLLEKSDNLNKEIYIVSDFQKSGFHPDSLDFSNTRIHFYGLPIQNNSLLNLSVDDAVLNTTILQKDKMVELAVTISNHSFRPSGNKLAQLYLNGNRVAQAIVNLGPGESVSEPFKFILDRTGFISGLLQLEEDDIDYDNRYYFTFYVPQVIHVGLIGQSTPDDEYIKLALQPAGQKTDFQVDYKPTEELRFLQPQDYDVVILSNLARLDESSIDAVKDFVTKGGGLLMVLGENCEIREYNNRIMPALTLPKILSTIGSIDNRGSLFSLGQVDLHHPIFRGIFEKDSPDFQKPQFGFALRCEEIVSAVSIMIYSTGDPFLFEKRVGQGTVIVFTSGFNLHNSNIIHSTIFAPLVARSVAYLDTRRKNDPSGHLVGDLLTVQLPATAIGKKLTFLRPDGSEEMAQPVITSAGATVRYAGTDIPGTYSLMIDEELFGQWAVNVDPRESRLETVSLGELPKNISIAILESNNNISKEIYAHRYGKELWKYLAIGALILLVVEMLIFREKGEVPA